MHSAGNDPMTFIDYLTLMADMDKEDKRLKQDLAKTNYLNIHKKRSKK